MFSAVGIQKSVPVPMTKRQLDNLLEFTNAVLDSNHFLAEVQCVLITESRGHS